MADGDELIKQGQNWSNLVPGFLVSDLDRSVDEYTNGFGFNLDHAESGRLAVVSRPGAQLILRQYLEGDPLVVAELATPFGRGVELIIKVTDLEDLYGRLRDAKHPILVPMEMSELTDGERQYTRMEFVVQDADGYLLRFTD